MEIICSLQAYMKQINFFAASDWLLHILHKVLSGEENETTTLTIIPKLNNHAVRSLG
jgi:hypothetical protein